MNALFLILALWVSSTEAFSVQQRSPRGIITQLASNGATAEIPCNILVTFDLDDTLFPISEVVQEANAAQINTMRGLGYDTTIEQFTKQTKAIRTALDGPISYSDLRKAAIRTEMRRLVGTDMPRNQMERHVEQAFNAWLQERHAASERHLFEDAIPALQELRSNFPSIQIGAITNGRGNPLDMKDTLAQFFDFCVSGEDSDVFPHRKPSTEIYQAALKRCEWEDKETDATRVWFHVGDCLANDVGASSDFGAHAIWVAKEEPEEQPFYSTASPEELAKRAKLMEAAREKLSGKIACLEELNSVLLDIIRTTSWYEKVPGIESGTAERERLLETA